jgi:hypothetical protein
MYASARIAVLGTSHNKLTSIIDTRPTYFVECVVNKTSQGALHVKFKRLELVAECGLLKLLEHSNRQ